MLIKNTDSADVSNLLYEALINLDYPSDRINNYVLLIEEALTTWREKLSPESELVFTRKDRRNDAYFELSVKDRRCDPFAKDAVINFEKPIRTMYDRLLSGIGTELRYSYKKGVNIISLRLPKTDIRETLFKRTALSSVLSFSFQYLITTLASNIGIIILGFLSAQAMSGAAFGSQIVIIHTTLNVAVIGSVTPLMSQFWGKRKGSSAIYAMWVAAAFSFIVCFAEFIAGFFFSEQLVGLYTDIPELIKEGAPYLHIASVSFLFNSFCCVFYSFLRVTGQGTAAAGMIASGCVLNIVLALLLVFGNLGLPRLGTVGAGIAMTAGALLQFILCVIYYIKIKPSFFNAGDEINKTHIIGTFFKNVLPIYMQVVVFLVGSNFIAAAIGRINAEVIAAYSFVGTVSTYLLSAKDACGETAQILTGLQLGRSRFEDAKREHTVLGRLVFIIGVCTMLALIAIVFLSRFLPLKLDAASRRYLLPIACFFALDSVFGFRNVLNNSTLYAGGQGRAVFRVDSVFALLYNVPLALVSIKLNCFAPMLMLFLCKIDEVITFMPKMLNVRKGKWLRNIVE